MSKMMVAFDLVGTLVNKDIFQDARGEFSLDCRSSWDPKSWDEAEKDVDFAHRFDYRAVIRRWLTLSERALVEALYDQFTRYLIDDTTQEDYLDPKAKQVLQDLHGRNLLLGFVTDGPDEVEGKMIKRILEASGIPDRECIIVTGERTGHPKSQTEPFVELIRLAREHGVKVESIFFIGDKPTADIDGPKKAGIEKTVLFAPGDEPELGEYLPWRTIDDLAKVVNLIDKEQGVQYGQD